MPLEDSTQFAASYVSKTGCGKDRLNAQSHKVPFEAKVERCSQEAAKRRRVLNVVVGRQASHHTIRILVEQRDRCKANDRRSAFGLGFQNEIGFRYGGSLGVQETRLLIHRHHMNAIGRDQREQAIDRKLKERAVSEQTLALLGLG